MLGVGGAECGDGCAGEEVGAVHCAVDEVVHHAHREEGQEQVEHHVHRVHVDLIEGMSDKSIISLDDG